MRKLTIFLSCLFIPFFLFSQHFEKAPKDVKPIKQITEWTTFLADEEDPEETIKDAVYYFKKDGKLVKWISNNAYDEIYSYKYDNLNRLENVTIENEEMNRQIIYTYYEDRRLAEIQEQFLDLRTIQYFNKKGKLIEEKTFWKGELTEDKWETMSRKVFNYNAQDSLFGEMEYSYVGNGKATKRKTVHNYDPNTHKKNSILYFNEKGKIEKTVVFKYYSDKNLKEKIINYHQNKTKEKTEYIYKNGLLWQEITSGDKYKYEKIYKNGRYVRYKEYDKNYKLIWYTDFQYDFY